MPTDVVPGSSRPSIALSDASSTRATTRGVPRTGTSPDPSASAVAAAARTTSAGERTVALTPVNAPRPNDIEVLPESIEKAAKVAILNRADAAARGESGAIKQVTARVADSRRRILVANSDGMLAED